MAHAAGAPTLPVAGGVAAAGRAGPAEARATRRPGTAAAAAPQGRAALLLVAAVVCTLPLAVPSGPANIVPEDVLIALALCACFAWGVTSGHRWRFPYAAPMALMLAGGALGAIVGPVPVNGVVALVQDVALLLWCWAVVNVACTAERARLLLAAWAYASIAWAALLYVGLATGLEALTGQVPHQGTRVQLTLADPSYCANYFFVSLMLMWATGRPRHRVARRLVYVALVAGIALTGSNSGAVSLVVGTAVAGLLALARRRGPVLALVVLSAGVVAAFAVTRVVTVEEVQERAHQSRISFVRDGVGRGTSLDQRTMLFGETVGLYRHEPASPLGAGPVSTKVRLRQQMAAFEKEAHDDYLAALVERGIVGFAGALLLVATLAAYLARIVGGRLRAEFAGVLAHPHALAGAVVGTLVAGTVYELLHVRHVWALFALVAAIAVWGAKAGPRR